MENKEYIKAQIRIDQLAGNNSNLTESEQQEFYNLDRACEEHENKLMKDRKFN